MKTKIISLVAVILVSVSAFSFRSSSGEGGGDVVLLSLINVSGPHQGFVITYGDGRFEKVAAEVRTGSISSWIEVQTKATQIMSMLAKKGYKYRGSHELLNKTMVFQKD